MATAHLNTFLRRLTRGMVAATLGNESDQELVEQFLLRRDEAVFEALVRRHGPMVYRVCWRVLQQEQDAEDAFQATFLLLAQNLPTVRKRHSLGCWLHGVARRVALMAKAQASRRRHHEQHRSPAVPSDEVLWKELRTVLDAELSRLPERWRLPLILCYLEGHTQEEAAAHLGWSRPTLQRRLRDARAVLGRRLKERGIWSAAFAALLLSDCTVSAARAPGLFATTIEAAAQVAAGRSATSVASAKVAALAQGVMKAMLMTKLKVVATLLLLLVAVSLGTAEMMTGAAPEPRVEKKGAVQVALAPVPADKASDKADLHRKIQTVTWFVAQVDGEGNTISLQLYPTTMPDAAIGELGTGPGGAAAQAEADRAKLEQEKVWRLRRRAETGGHVPQHVQPGISLRLPVAKDAGIVVDGREGKLADVRSGMQVLVQVAKEKATIIGIEATTPGRTILKAIDVEKKTITVTTDGREWTVQVAGDANLAIIGRGNWDARTGKVARDHTIAGNQKTQLSDLKPGMRVNLQLVADEDRIVAKVIQASVE
jgi:RNA polymerase sigma factor (sigma-70 family)